MMREALKIFRNKQKNTSLEDVQDFHPDLVGSIRTYHESFPEYKVTPLAQLENLSNFLGVESIAVKDESFRFDLNAFKVLGGSYAIGAYIADRLNLDRSSLTFDQLNSPDVHQALGDLTFITATDGNHGRGVAWTSQRLKQKCVVYMPKGSALERLNNIKALGAEASILDVNYDDAVRQASRQAKEHGWVLVQDTAWEGYQDIPKWIMQGYTTMVDEALEQMAGERPTHVFLQAGVGAMAGAVTAYLRARFGDQDPLIVIVEPNRADCLYRSARAQDGKVHFVKGDLDTIMAGLACGEPCTIAWNILQNHADYFVSMPDKLAGEGMRVLGNPLGGDPRVISGESGAATMGLVAEVLRNPNLDEVKEELQLSDDSNILCFSTEGDTDCENYRQVVWDGFYPTYQ